MNTGKWTKDENSRFVEAMTKFINWDTVANKVGTRTIKQCRSHDQKYRKDINLIRYNQVTVKELDDIKQDIYNELIKNRKNITITKVKEDINNKMHIMKSTKKVNEFKEYVNNKINNIETNINIINEFNQNITKKINIMINKIQYTKSHRIPSKELIKLKQEISRDIEHIIIYMSNTVCLELEEVIKYITYRLNYINKFYSKY